MGPGLSLLVIGALLAFAVEDDVPALNLDVAGLILMLAGAALVAHARATARRERVVTRREGTTDPATPTRVVEEVVRDQRTD